MFKNKSLIIILLCLPAVIFFPLPWLADLPLKKIWKRELIYSGYSGLVVLLISLLLTPFVKLFSKIGFFKQINRHRRAIGVAAFAYLAAHFFSYLMKSYYKRGYIDFTKFLKPLLLTGSLAFLLLIPLVLTSNNYSMKRLGWDKWKKIHRLVYVSEALACIHLYLSDPLWTILLFTPVAIFQGLRMAKN